MPEQLEPGELLRLDPNLAGRRNLVDLPSVADLPLRGAVPDGAAAPGGDPFTRLAVASLAPPPGCRWPTAPRRSWSPATTKRGLYRPTPALGCGLHRLPPGQRRSLQAPTGGRADQVAAGLIYQTNGIISRPLRGAANAHCR